MNKDSMHRTFVPSLLKTTILSGLIAAAGASLPAAVADDTTALSANDFLDSIGASVHVQHRQPAAKLAPLIKYAGFRAVRDGADGNFDMNGLLLLHREDGIEVVFGPGSGAHDAELSQTITACNELAQAGALLAVEGPNEPNNFGGVTYQGKNSNKSKSWLPVANFQKDLYQAVKNDPELKNYPVYGISETGAESDNVGLQFLTIPEGAHTLMPDGTKYADFINCHNYVCGHMKTQIDNEATLAASTKPKAAIDHLFGNHGLTWGKKFTGYTEKELDTIPKVTTETGAKSDNTPAGDDQQGKLLVNTYLAQYKAGWKHTFVYELTDDSDGSFGFFKGDLKTPRKAADYLHNLTTILADNGTIASPGKVDYSIQDKPATVHDMLLQKNDGTYELAVWGERVKGENNVTVALGRDCPSVKVYDPTAGVTPSQTLANVSSVPLTLGDHVMILEFK